MLGSRGEVRPDESPLQPCPECGAILLADLHFFGRAWLQLNTEPALADGREALHGRGMGEVVAVDAEELARVEFPCERAERFVHEALLARAREEEGEFVFGEKI